MTYFFVKDCNKKYCLFTSEPEKPLAIKRSRPKELWETAQKKLLLLPHRLRRQEQAFMSGLKENAPEIRIYHSGCRPEKRVRLGFSFFLQKQRSKHILLLIGETLLLPISGLAMLLPGPNVFFGALALLMITHWRALRGINRLARKNHGFVVAPLFADWEEAVALAQEKRYSEILHKLEKGHQLEELNKMLWK